MGKLQNIQAVCFDFGNTLVYPDYQFIQKLLAEYGVHADVAKLRTLEFGAQAAMRSPQETPRWKTYFRTWFIPTGINEENLPEIFDRLSECFQQNRLWSCVDEDAVATLTELKNRRYSLGVISNSDGNLKRLMDAASLSNYFDVMVDSEKVGTRKPEPAIFNYALEKLSVQPEEAIYVGDVYEIDILGAQRAGLNAVLFDPMNRQNHGDCLKITRLSQLLLILNRCR